MGSDICPLAPSWRQTVTYGATTLGVVGPREPTESGPLSSRLAAHFAYQREGFIYEQIANWFLVTALLSMGLLGVLCHATPVFEDRVGSAIAASVLAMGATLAAAAQVVYLAATGAAALLQPVRGGGTLCC